MKSPDFEGQPAQPDPEPVVRLDITGQHGADDFGIQHGYLVVSDSAFSLLRLNGLAQAEVFKYDPDPKPPTMDEFWASRGLTPLKEPATN